MYDDDEDLMQKLMDEFDVKKLEPEDFEKLLSDLAACLSSNIKNTKQAELKKSKALFIRKPNCLETLLAETSKYFGRDELEEAFIQNDICLSNEDYDDLVSDFHKDRLYLKNKGGITKEYTRFAVRVSSPNRRTLLIDPQGFAHARYVGFEIE